MAILKKFIGLDQIGADQILLEPNTALRAANSQGQATELLKLDPQSVLQFLKLPRVALDPEHGNDIVRKSWVDLQIQNATSGASVEIAVVDAKLTTEKERALSAEQALGEAISSESSRALQAEAALSSAVSNEVARAMGKETELELAIASKIPLAYMGAANGVTPLDAQQKIPTQYLPALAITEVFVVTTLAQRDALVGAGSVQTGDVVKVTEALTASDGVSKLPRSYIYDGTQYVELNTESDVDSVNGKVGHVSLTTADVPASGDSRYYTDALESAMANFVQSQVQTEATARQAADTLIRTDFAAADAELLSDIQGEISSNNAVIIAAAESAAQTQVLVEQVAREAEDLTFLKLDGTRAMTGALQMSGQGLTGVASLAGQGGNAISISSELTLSDKKIGGLATPTASTDAATKGYVDTATSDITSKYGQASGIATLDNQGKLNFSQIPAIAITDVYVVQNIAARDALVIEEGDVAKVIEAELASNGTTMLSRTYIYAVDNQSQIGSWIEIQSESDVMSVAGKVGHVALDTGDVSEKVGGPLYFTEARAKTAAVVNSMAGSETEQAPSVSAAKAYVDGQLDTLSIAMPEYQAFTLAAQDLTNGYIDLSFSPTKPPMVIRQGLVGRNGYDFSYSGSRITFINDWAVNGLTEIEAGDLVEVHYQKVVTPFAS